MPIPPPMSSQLLRARTGAFSRRGKNARGTESSRPSASRIYIRPSMKATHTATGSNLVGKVTMQSLKEARVMFVNHLLQPGQLAAAETAIAVQRHRLKPELSISFGLRNMDVWRLLCLVAEKEEPMTPEPQHSGHGCSTSAPRPGPAPSAWARRAWERAQPVHAAPGPCAPRPPASSQCPCSLS